MMVIGDDGMFRERLLRWTTILDLVASDVGSVFQAAAAWKSLGFNLGRRWESTSEQRNFELRLAAQRTSAELQGRLPLAR